MLIIILSGQRLTLLKKILKSKMYIFLFLILVGLSFSLEANEKILICEMNFGISGENDETDIEFKNLSIVDQDQVIYLDIDNKWLSVESQKDLRKVEVNIASPIFLNRFNDFFNVLSGE